MTHRNLSATIATVVGLAAAVAVPAAQAKAPVAGRPAASFYTAQALAALNARWNAQAAKFETERAIAALDARWNAEAASYEAARALVALDARWNAEARHFGLR